MHTMTRLRISSRFLLAVLACFLALALSVGHVNPVAAATLAPSVCSPNCTYTVNTTQDTHDATPNFVCADLNGLCSLRAAIEEADADTGDVITINVPANTYGLTLGTLPLTSVPTSITINGSGSNNTIISGNNTFGIMSVSSGAQIYLRSLTIKGGSAPYGGGIANGGTLTVTNSAVNNNTATNSGGGILNTGTLTVQGSMVSNNTAPTGYGGGIYNGNGTATLTVQGSKLVSNSANTGGGIWNVGGTLTVQGSRLVSNSATFGGGGGIYNEGTLTVGKSFLIGNISTDEDGGGIYNINGMVTVKSSTLTGNKATLSGDGGGIGNDSGTVSVTSSTLSNNSGNRGGGIESEGSATLTVTSSTFSGNKAAYTGGGIANGGTLTITNSTFSGNKATGNGGGIANDGGEMTVTSSTLSGNKATSGGSGGGIYNDPDYVGGTATLTGTIVANSVGLNCSGTITEGAGYNLDSGNSCGFSLGTDLINTNPLLGLLLNNGGNTQTMALQTGSPAIDWVATSSCPVTDQRGQMRPDDNSENTCDIGAYESFKLG